MARTVDPERHLARRLAIIDAALTRFAADGYERTTTAAICREAGIGSGTFFHYFPTKQSLLLAILELGTSETADWFAAQDLAASPRSVVDAYVRHAVAELADPRVAGFVRAVGAVMAEPEVAAALAHDARTLQEGLEPWVARAQQDGAVRTDLTARDLTAWLLLVVDGFLGRLATDDDFTAADQAPVLEDAVARLLAP
ncbi:TetR/AcrR family transcriptional regulator [Microbacterium sp. ARD31]|uniref:TetR/AcrR family transcriptional regulator n=1 Tax=Microbacterium sp. ARD31 TaxID=2962576 RepID=UPI002880E7BF|nr:TetR/AcrR family transcriptional regulator [Microbacterium sp. ARD31]MDT0186189.1 TetR/AcrR family transcriptional regulator [Microbacterium sp. ARD31]